MEFFDIVGGFGRWQLRIFLFLLYVNIVGMWQNFSIVFQTPNMKFRCIQPSSEQLYSNSSSVFFDNRCEVPQEENSSILAPCTEWEYDTSSTSDTIVSEWDLVCSREWLISLVKSMYMVGFLLSVLIFGQISDLVGRFPTIVICYCITCVSMFLSLLSNSFSMFITLRFFQAFGRAGITTTGYVLIREIVGSEHQTVMGLAIQVGWSIGFVTLVGVAWFFRNWFWLQLVIALSFIPIVFAFGIISESPRWLLTRGKTKKLERLLTKAAAINGRKVKDDEIEDFKLLNNKHEYKLGGYAGRSPNYIKEHGRKAIGCTVCELTRSAHELPHFTHGQHAINMNRYTNAELVDIHLNYSSANGNGRVADDEERYSIRRQPNHQTFARMHQNLAEDGSFRATIDDKLFKFELHLVA
ncbi:organic cation transporter protein [Trichonephila clavipes]|nr:organic cation transporter protein [Trichonephila clavipes]